MKCAACTVGLRGRAAPASQNRTPNRSRAPVSWQSREFFAVIHVTQHCNQLRNFESNKSRNHVSRITADMLEIILC